MVYTQARSSPLKNSLAWFKHGCCVPSNTVLWIIIVLFMFTVLLFVCCCLTITFTRWMYVRTIRNKCDLLKKKYEEQGKSKKETDLRMKEFSMRPVRTHHYHQFGRASEKPATSVPLSPAVPDMPVDRHRTGYPLGKPAFPTSTPSQEQRASHLFTGATPLSSPHPPQPSTSGSQYPSSKSTSPAPFARSTTPTVAGTATIVEMVMEPHDIAATTHAIAASKIPLQARPAFPGLLLLNKDTTHGQCPSDRVSLISSDERVTPIGKAVQSNAASAVPSAAKFETSPYDSLKQSKPGKLSEDPSLPPKIPIKPTMMKRPSRTNIRVSRAIASGSPTGKRTSFSVPDESSSLPQGSDAPTASKPSSQSFFPYWTDQRHVVSKVDPKYSSSGAGRTTKMTSTKITSTETNIWAPTGTSTNKQRPSSGTDSTPSKNDKSSNAPPPPIAEPPADVYELRRRLERARENERVRAMMEEADQCQVQYSPILITSVPNERRTPAHLQGNIQSRDGTGRSVTQL